MNAARQRWAAAAALLLLPFLVLGVLDAGRRGARFARRHGWRLPRCRPAAPAAALPAAPAPEARRLRFELDASNALRMEGSDDSGPARAADVAGNYYTGEFLARFRYADTSPDGPRVWCRFEPAGPVFRGRLEARRLKPNFAYQVKLLGDFRDRQAFERIGYIGRWRLPGDGTNYSDWDYEAYPAKDKVEAYVLFDFFVTNERGDATLDFALKRSDHVLWNWTRQRAPDSYDHVIAVRVHADNPAVYARPKTESTIECIYPESELIRHWYAGRTIRLPPGSYSAYLALTEESFHSVDRDGGYWAMPYRLPVQFTITPPDR